MADYYEQPFYVPEWERYCEIVRLDPNNPKADQPNEPIMKRVISGGAAEADGYVGTGGKYAVEVKYLNPTKPNKPVINVDKYNQVINSLPHHMGFLFAWNHAEWNHLVILKQRNANPVVLPAAKMWGGTPDNKAPLSDDKKMAYPLDRLPTINIDI